MSSGPWNHNIHYHDVVLRSVPHRAARALDVGCGQGLLARRLAGYCDEVIGIDVDHHAILGARAAPVEEGRLTFVEGDVMTHPFSAGSFDLIAAVATLHHLPLRPALTRFRNLLKPGGVLTIIGLYRGDTLADLAFMLWHFQRVGCCVGCVVMPTLERHCKTQEKRCARSETRAIPYCRTPL